MILDKKNFLPVSYSFRLQIMTQ